jgi:hypothetical protein
LELHLVAVVAPGPSRRRAVVTRYFFDIRVGTDVDPDEGGTELPDHRAAEIEAAHTLVGLTRDLAALDDPPDMAVEVRTKDGPLMQVALIYEANKLGR